MLITDDNQLSVINSVICVNATCKGELSKCRFKHTLLNQYPDIEDELKRVIKAYKDPEDLLGKAYRYFGEDGKTVFCIFCQADLDSKTNVEALKTGLISVKNTVKNYETVCLQCGIDEYMIDSNEWREVVNLIYDVFYGNGQAHPYQVVIVKN